MRLTPAAASLASIETETGEAVYQPVPHVAPLHVTLLVGAAESACAVNAAPVALVRLALLCA
jgi:hypothetical protein